MSRFIDISDYDASIHSEILDSLLRSDMSLIEICEDRAVAEMRGYMRSRYDCDAIFGAEGEGRHPLVLMMAIDISIYHAFCIHNPQKMSAIRQRRYERAVEWLKGVQTGAVVIDGAQRLEEAAAAMRGRYQMGSNAKRDVRL